MRFLGICRQTEFSPNHVMSDRLIFTKTTEALARRGVEVVAIDESEVGAGRIGHALVFSMAQGPRASEVLARIERAQGCLIVNSPRAVMNCYRVHMARHLPAAGIPFPRSVIVDTAHDPLPDALAFTGKTWVKRGDVHAVHLEDVTLAYRPQECREVLQEFRQRGITHAVLQEHVPGDVVKFYAVRGEGFFEWFYLNGGSAPFDPGKLQALADASAQALSLDVYGGDAIVGPDGRLVIIDVNDWPSFSAVRDAASEAIASLLVRKGLAHVGD
jgi:glutathione synthase/RimK-type ligase-like ATP-grasp enzyme